MEYVLTANCNGMISKIVEADDCDAALEMAEKNGQEWIDEPCMDIEFHLGIRLDNVDYSDACQTLEGESLSLVGGVGEDSGYGSWDVWTFSDKS